MKSKKFIIGIIYIVIVLIIGTIATVLLINNGSNIDLNKLSSFEYYSGSSSATIKFDGSRNQESIVVKFTNFDGGEQNTQSFTIFTDDFIDLLRNTKKESCKKHTYEYQCGESSGCAHSSLFVKFESDDDVCYKINSEIVEYFKEYSRTYLKPVQ